MKPRIFIGSSTEALDVAYAIQQNLERDSNATVWTQGIFELSNNTLEDLLIALENFDCGVFVFKPDDISLMRSDEFNTARDNVIFELGLFIGKLGKEKVFFVSPQDSVNFHLPTDLLGINPGQYNDMRENKNMIAALGPFCNQVRVKLKKFLFENLVDLANENEEIKRIAIEKPKNWEYLLTSELIKSRMIEINRSYEELEKGLVFQKSVSYNALGFIQWVKISINDFIKLVDIYFKIIKVELIEAWGEPGVPGNINKIKSAADKIASICKEFLKWEYELQGVIAPDNLKEAVELMKGWTKGMIGESNKFPKSLDEYFSVENLANEGRTFNKLTFPKIPNMKEITDIIKNAGLSYGAIIE